MNDDLFNCIADRVGQVPTWGSEEQVETRNKKVISELETVTATSPWYSVSQNSITVAGPAKYQDFNKSQVNTSVMDVLEHKSVKVLQELRKILDITEEENIITAATEIMAAYDSLFAENENLSERCDYLQGELDETHEALSQAQDALEQDEYNMTNPYAYNQRTIDPCTFMPVEVLGKMGPQAKLKHTGPEIDLG
jgi:hypothetical protein